MEGCKGRGGAQSEGILGAKCRVPVNGGVINGWEWGGGVLSEGVIGCIENACKRRC